MVPTPRRRSSSKELEPPNMSGDSASFLSSCLSECDRYLERLRLRMEVITFGGWSRREQEKLREVNAATIRFFKEFDWLIKEENPLITGHLTGIAVELDKVIMKATMAKWRLFGLFQREEKERLRREVIELTRDLKRCLEIYTAPDDELDGVIMAKRRSFSILNYWLWMEEERERLRKEEEERLKEVNAATIRFFVEFDWLIKEENPLITGHLTGIAAELDKVIMKATMVKWSIFRSCVPECDRYLKRLRTVKEELLSVRKLYRLRKNYWGLFGLFQREEKERLREVIEKIKVLSLEICPAPDDELDRVNMAKRREVIEETNKFYKEFDGWFKEENPLIAGHLAGFADKLDKVIMKDTMAMQSGAQRGSTNRLMSLYEDTASDSEQERYKMTPILLSALKRVSLAYFSIPSFVQLHRQANLSRSTPHSHALGGADTGKALLPPVLVSTLKDAMADLSLVGGGSLDETIRRILQAVLKDEVASELYWAGHGSKQSFQQANLQEVIFRASGKKYSGEAAFGDVWPHQHQHQLQHQQCMLVKAF